MALLSTEDRQRVWRGLMRAKKHFGWSGTKSDLRAAVDATDTWINNNQASYNSALPEPFATNATIAQKTFLFCMVAVARVSIAALRRLVGEVD